MVYLKKIKIIEELKLLKYSKKYIKKYFIYYLIFIICHISKILVNLLQPIVWAKFISILFEKKFDNLQKYIFFLMGIYLINIFLEFAYTYLSKFLNKSIECDLKSEMMDNMLNFKIDIFDNMKIGEFVSRFHSDVVNISNFIINTITVILIDIFKVVIIGSVIAFMNIPLMIIMLISSIISSIIFTFYGKKLRQKYISFRKIADKYFSNMYETITGIREIKNLGIKKVSYKKSYDIFNEIKNKEIQYQVMSSYSDSLVQFVDMIAYICMLVVASYYIYINQLLVESFIVFYSYSDQFRNSLKNIIKLNSTVQQSLVSFDRVFNMIHNNDFKEVNKGDISLKEVKGKICFNKVDFSYHEECKVLKEISFDIGQNQKVAIVGKSGSGKTTIFNLISRMYTCKNGGIQIDNVNIEDIKEEDLRKHLTIVSQNPFLFNCSIAENFSMINQNITQEEIEICCRRAYIHDFIMGLPQKYNSIISENSINLSGGQKQRLAIARALAKGSKIILLDEITASLDNEAQDYINKTITEIRKDHTIVIVSHKISNIIDSDKILVIDEGKIVSIGEHDQLIKANDIYISLYELENIQ